MDPLGFNWKMDVALLTGVAAKELVVSSLGVMYSGPSSLTDDIDWPAALAFMVFVLLYFPCVATFVTIKNETGKWIWAIGTCAYTMVVAWLCSFIVFRAGMLFF